MKSNVITLENLKLIGLTPNDIINYDKRQLLNLRCKIYHNLNKEKVKEYRNNNKEKIRQYQKEYRNNNKQYQKEYRNNNKQKIRQSQKKYRDNNKKKLREINKKYRDNNKEKIRKYENNRLKNDIQFKLKYNLRRRLYSAIKNNYKAGSAVSDLGCNIEQLKQYIESKWLPGMNWDNWNQNGWHIDHIKPNQ